MKHFTSSILTLILLCITYSAQAQYRRVNYFPDSIRVEFPEQKGIVVFEVRRFQEDFHFIESFSTTLKDLLIHVQKAFPRDINEAEPHRIVVKIKAESEKLIISSGMGNFYKPEGEKTEITISDLVPQTTLTIKQNTIEQLFPPGWEMFISAKDVNVTIYAASFEGLESLAQQDFASVVSTLQADSKTKYIGKKRIQSRLIVQQGKIDKSIINYIYPGDLIFLTGHAGVGLLRDKFYPELSGSIGLYFSDHFNRRNHRIELIYNNMFFAERKTEGGFTTNSNAFLSLAYSKNFGQAAHSQWTTLGVGLLVNKNGDYFQGKTAKLFFSSNIGSPKLNLVPEFYLTDDFKKFAFGIKLNYTF